ncbi:MAG: calcium/sodium antiporter [Thermogutta sp.]|nr:calcium/sodium antiporter [Thermogutta sp.]
MLQQILLIAAGFVCLTLGGEVLVRGALGLAKRLGMSELIIGLTVVSFATSAPELAVSVDAAYSGYADVAFGNVVGSNIFNVLFVLGLSALAAPLIVSPQLLKRDVPVMVGLSILTYLIARDGVITHLEGAFLLVLMVIYLTASIILVQRENRESPGHAEGSDPAHRQDGLSAASSGAGPSPSRKGGAAALLGYAILVILGVAILVLGAKLFVDGAVSLARAWGVSELIIAVTLVAAATSLPEAATSVTAGLRGRRDIAIGNVVGSNIFNILVVLGLGALAAKDGMAVAAEALRTDLPVMIGVAVACLPIFFSRRMVTRVEGALLFAYYLTYTANLALAVTHSPWFEPFRNTVFYGVFPLTAVFLALSLLRSPRSAS